MSESSQLDSNTRVNKGKGSQRYKPFKNQFVGPTGWHCRSRARQPKWQLLSQGCTVAVDCEGVTLWDEVGIRRCGLASLAIVNSKQEIVYDPFGFHPAGTNWSLPPKNKVSVNIKRHELTLENGAIPVQEIYDNAKRIFDMAGKIVGHDIQKEFNYLRCSSEDVQRWHAEDKVRDTQRVAEWKKHGKGDKPGLKDVVRAVLGTTIQESKGHSAIEDTRATMELYKVNEESIEEQQTVVRQAAQETEIRATRRAGFETAEESLKNDE